MELSAEQLERFRRDGLLWLPRLEPTVLEEIEGELDRLLSTQQPGHVFEKDGRTLRALHGCHRHSEALGRLVRHPRLLLPARELIGGDVYVYQFKINLKRSFDGDVWPWHQDFTFWREEDGLDENRTVNAVVFLDEVTEFNAPMLFIPGSHRMGAIPAAKRPPAPGASYLGQLSADLDYALDRETVRAMAARWGLQAPKGPAGSVLFFDANLAHASAGNISPFDRRLAIVTYNSVTNTPRPRGEPRPEFLVSRDHAPLIAIGEEGPARREPAPDPAGAEA